ncbi:hypothetical protein [Streptomyces mirabilis]
MSGTVLGEADQFEGVLGLVAVEHLAGHAREDVGAEDHVVAGVGGAQGEEVVVLGAALESRVPGHGGCRAGQLRHHLVQALLNLRRLVFVEVGSDLAELAQHGLAAQTATVPVVPGPERASRGRQLLDLPCPEPTAATWPGGGARRLEPSFQGIEQGGAGDGGPGQVAGRRASVHHEIAPRQVRGQVHSGIRPPRDLIGAGPLALRFRRGPSAPNVIARTRISRT